MYQNPYTFGKEADSLNVDPKINGTLKENKEWATAEVEKDELILRPDLSAIHKAVGKTHAGGGVKTYLPEGSFVFSNDPKLALDETDYELFEVKEVSNSKKRKNTPAKVIQNSFKPEEYNKMVSKLTSKTTDNITKKSAELMLNKYMDTLGKVAYIQEGKKDYPQGVPDFAKDTAPVYDTQVKNDIMENKQYMKAGGFVNPYKMSDGGLKKSYNPNLANQDKEFLSWYRQNTLEGKNNIPYSDKQSYDYYSFYRNGEYQNKNFNINQHFPDTYKRPNHPTFSNESIYSIPENTGGSWRGEEFIPANPKLYLNKMAIGGEFTDPYTSSNTKAGRTTPTGKSSLYNRGPEYLQSWESVIPGISKMDNKTAQSIIYQYTLKNNPEQVSNMWEDYGLNNKGLRDKTISSLATQGKFTPQSLTPDVLSKLGSAYTDGYFGARQLENKEPNYGGVLPPVTVKSTPRKPNPFVQTPGPDYPGMQVPADGTEDINWKYNFYQKANMAADALQYASINQENPYRSQMQSPLVELERLNPQSALNQVTNQASQSYQANKALNPYIAGANNAQTFGRSVDALNQVQSQYDNQNVQIANQQNLTNNQIQRQDLGFNVQADQQYYQQGVEGRKNFDNLKQFAFNNARNNFNKYTTDNQTLAYNMAQTPYAPFKYDFNTGQFQLTGNRSILDSQGTQGQDAIQDQIEYIKNSSASEDAKLKAISELWKSKAIAPLLLQNRKKGGMIENPYRKNKK